MSPLKPKHPTPKSKGRIARLTNLLALVIAFGLLAVITQPAAAQPAIAQPPLAQNGGAADGSCADLDASVIEPLLVSWQSDSDPILDPSYSWAYGDVDLLTDDAVDEYWFHWYDAAPDPDPYVVYEFAAGTTIEAVQFTNDWSEGNLELQGLDAAGQPVGALNSVPLGQAYVSQVSPLTAASVSAMKMTTSLQQVKLLELDFCGTSVPDDDDDDDDVDDDGDTQGTCADLGASVVEPILVSWQSDSEPVLNPSYGWAYGDLDVLTDDELDDYWFHWYDAVPGSNDAYVVYQFGPNTTIEGLQFTNDWSEGNLELQGLNAAGQPVGASNSVPLGQPYVSQASTLTSESVSAVKMTTSTQHAKLIELDFCGEGGDEQTELNLVASSPTCETITASWTQQPNSDHRITVTNSAQDLVVAEGGLVDSFGPLTVDEGTYAVTLAATSATDSVLEVVSVAVDECVDGECGNNDPADAYCESVNVIESFGDAPLPAGADTGMAWNTVREYYDAYGDRPGMCSIDIHNSYWTAVRDADGVLTYYPSWHPPSHNDGQCIFTHDHGVDPRGSNLYDEAHPSNIGAPFGFVHPGSGGLSGRVEDHVGHKVIVANDFQLTTNNPFAPAGTVLSLFTLNDGSTVTCDWYSKLHQGTHSPDALGFNLHEYYLNYSCDDGTEVRIKEMTDFGFFLPGEGSVAGPDPDDFPLTETGVFNSDCAGWFATNHPGPATDPDPHPDSDFGDAGRGANCLMSDAKLQELWKASARIGAPDSAASLDYDAYYLVMNGNRYGLYRWWDFLEQDGDHVGDTAMISTVDFCVEGTELRDELSRPDAPDNFVKAGQNYEGTFRVRTFCEAIDPTVIAQWEQDIVDAGGDSQALMLERKYSAENSFNGTVRGVHTKGPRVYGGQPNFDELAYFCTNHLGNDPFWPTNPDTGALVTTSDPWSPGDPTPVCNTGVAQMLSTFNNGHNPVEGSTAGANGLIGQGPAREITIDMNELYPNNGVQAPN